MKTEGPLFYALPEVEAPHGLRAAILARIAVARTKSARQKTLFLGVASLLFGIALIPILQYAGREFYASGFYDYSSLLFSDSGFVISIWREFALSLIESLPALAILLVLSVSVALAWSLRRTFVHARTAFSF